MSIKNSIPLRTTIAIGITALFVLLFLLVEGYMWTSGKSALIKDAEDRIKQDMAILRQQLEESFVNKDHHKIRQIISSRGVNVSYDFLAVIDAQMHIHYADQKNTEGQLVTQTTTNFSERHFEKTIRLNRLYISRMEQNRIFAYIPITIIPFQSSLRSKPDGVILLIYNTEPELNALSYALLVNSLTFGLALIAALIATYLLAKKYITQPVETLIRSAESIASKQMVIPIPIKGNGEFAQLAASITTMGEKLTANINELNDANMVIKLNEHKLKALLNTLPCGVQETDLKGTIIYSNPQHHRILEVSNNAIVGKHVSDFALTSLDKAQISDDYQQVVKEMPEPKPYRTQNSKESGELVDLEINWSYVYDQDNRLSSLISVITDITEQVKQEQKIYKEAYYDTLTGLPNRRLCLDRLEETIKQAKRRKTSFTLLFIDVDNFKQINDSYGHESGDMALKTVASRLTECSRQYDVVARLAGDEFLVTLQDINATDSISRYIKKVQSAFEPIVTLPNNDKLTLSLSIGIAIYNKDGDTSTALLHHADKAMYQAKKSPGVSFAFFEDSM